MESGYVMKRLGLFFIPVIVSTIFIILMWLGLEPDMFAIIGLLLLSYFISPFGREVLIPAAVISLLGFHGINHMFMDIILVVGVVVFVDIMCSIFLLWNLDLLKYLPVFGKWIDSIEKFGKAKLKKSKRKQQNTFFLLTGYVALPFQGSGGIVSTIIGMLTGLKKQRVWLSVWIGSFVGSLIIAILSFSIGEMLMDIFGSTIWYFLGLFLMLSIIIYIVLGYRKAKIKSASPGE
ncbi:MAG: small multi-drug export protein [Thermoplasmata archaeon]|nr:small multi-drug export protein [Thermoplasmata archaeon]